MRYITTLILAAFLCLQTNAQVDWGIGTKWTYTFVDNFDGFLLPATFEITDLDSIGREEVFLIEGNIIDTTYIRIEDNQVLFWIESIDDFAVGYDFGNDSSYITPYQSLDGKAFTSVAIDSSDTQDVRGRILAIDWYNMPDTVSSMRAWGTQKVYENIGYASNGMVSWLDGEIWAGSYWMDDIRCFENKGDVINFQNIPCDTVINLSSNTNDPYQDIVKVQPNPSHGAFTITESTGSEYAIHDAQGKRIKQGIMESEELILQNPGMYFIKLYYHDQWIVRQIVITP